MFSEERDALLPGPRLVVPLSAPGRIRIDGFAMIGLAEPIAIDHTVERIVGQLAEPLHVALEREAIHRALDFEREKAYQRSIRDPLTGLFTRFYMQEALARHAALHDRDPDAALGAILLDVDHFKRINDTYGHGAGDAVLRQVAAVVRDTCRGTDIPVRYGGEEFVVFAIGRALHPGTLAERLRACIAARPFEIDAPSSLRVTASFGVARRRPGEALEHWLQRADTALYRAKENGRDRIEYAVDDTVNT